jgi:hypothetical protein
MNEKESWFSIYQTSALNLRFAAETERSQNKNTGLNTDLLWLLLTQGAQHVHDIICVFNKACIVIIKQELFLLAKTHKDDFTFLKIPTEITLLFLKQNMWRHHYVKPQRKSENVKPVTNQNVRKNTWYR